MKKTTLDIYIILFNITKSSRLSYIISLFIVSILDFFILNGLIILFKDMFSFLKSLDILFTAKNAYITYSIVLLIIFLLNPNISALNSRVTKKPNYAKIVLYVLLTILLLAYGKFIKIMDQ